MAASAEASDDTQEEKLEENKDAHEEKKGWVPKYSSEDMVCTECICGYSCGTTAALHRCAQRARAAAPASVCARLTLAPPALTPPNPACARSHLDKHQDRAQHAAKSAGKHSGKQWVASGSVKQRSELFEKRIRAVATPLSAQPAHAQLLGGALYGSEGSPRLSAASPRQSGFGGANATEQPSGAFPPR